MRKRPVCGFGSRPTPAPNTMRRQMLPDPHIRAGGIAVSFITRSLLTADVTAATLDSTQRSPGHDVRHAQAFTIEVTVAKAQTPGNMAVSAADVITRDHPARQRLPPQSP